MVNRMNVNRMVLRYLISKLKERGTFYGKLQVMKLMFLIDHFDPKKRRIVKKSLLNNKYYIYAFGPFSFEVSEEYDRLKDGKPKIDERLKEKVDFIIEKFGNIDQWVLSEKCMKMLGITVKNKGRFLGFRVDEIVKN